ncbi:hypothetical protein [Halomonas sp. JS92-SW72]|uniref:hypothetical protein n=1 Tax=Halomonas sp. JS92-SW72 TaxID=2306583 RepID=UPI000E5AE793|nr:hypothetical protein [Halomonas sp. JS92-SW72]AXY43209.1 hypothetical protein D1793_13860 [Halomonas sp. JS92-SW72]
MPTSVSSDPAISRPPLLRLLVLFTLGTVAVALWYLTSYSLRGDGDVRWYAEEAGCELSRGPCQALLGEGASLTLDLGAEGEIRALELLPMSVALEGVEADSVVVDFVGRDMDMGLHRYPLARQADGAFRGEGQIPICTEAVMPWRARVIVTRGDHRLGSGFNFEVERSRL